MDFIAGHPFEALFGTSHRLLDVAPAACDKSSLDLVDLATSICGQDLYGSLPRIRHTGRTSCWVQTFYLASGPSKPWWHQPILTATYIEVLTLSLWFIFVCGATRDILSFVENCHVNCADPIMQSLYGDCLSTLNSTSATSDITAIHSSGAPRMIFPCGFNFFHQPSLTAP